MKTTADPVMVRCTASAASVVAPPIDAEAPRMEGSHLVFRFRDDSAAQVDLFGDFGGYMTVVARFTRGVDGLFTARIPAPLPGRYRYQFVVDGARWLADPSHGFRVDDGFGGFNSRVVVGWDVR